MGTFFDTPASSPITRYFGAHHGQDEGFAVPDTSDAGAHPGVGHQAQSSDAAMGQNGAEISMMTAERTCGQWNDQPIGQF
jgi:hypothetical protein